MLCCAVEAKKMRCAVEAKKTMGMERKREKEEKEEDDLDVIYLHSKMQMNHTRSKKTARRRMTVFYSHFGSPLFFAHHGRIVCACDVILVESYRAVG